MSPTIQLVIHNVAGVVSAISLLGIGLFTFLNNPKKTANVVFSLTALSASVFALSHVIGANISDPHTSKLVLMLNLSIFFIAAFQLHSIYALTGLNIKRSTFIKFIYFSAITLTLIFIANSTWFLLDSVPKMYFINYYNPGILNWVRLAFLYGIIIPLALYELFMAYKKATNDLEKNQYKYFFISLFIAYGIGFILNFLVYDIQINPLLGMAFGFFMVFPFAYGAIKYKLFNIQVIAKQAFFYSIAIAIVGGLIVLLNYFNNKIIANYPGFPIWSMALISSVLVVTLSVLTWRHLREADILKYEFITTVTHKFRTPLTHIKWASENIYQTNHSKEISTQLDYIQSANTKLVELTNLLVNVSETESSSYDYNIHIDSISDITEDVIKTLEIQLRNQQAKIIRNIQPNLNLELDTFRIRFVIQTLIENAIHYSSTNSVITISVFQKENDIVCAVKDNGIGLNQDEIPRLFSKFYRGKSARMADTEGMGIGLFISKQIIEKHSGKIWAESEGQDKGSIFAFSIPIKNNKK